MTEVRQYGLQISASWYRKSEIIVKKGKVRSFGPKYKNKSTHVKNAKYSSIKTALYYAADPYSEAERLRIFLNSEEFSSLDLNQRTKILFYNGQTLWQQCIQRYCENKMINREEFKALDKNSKIKLLSVDKGPNENTAFSNWTEEFAQFLTLKLGENSYFSIKMVERSALQSAAGENSNNLPMMSFNRSTIKTK